MTVAEKDAAGLAHSEHHSTQNVEESLPRSKSGKKAAKGATKKPSRKAQKRTKKVATRRPYPREPLEKSLKVPFALKDKNGGNPWPPADLAKSLGLSHKSNEFFYLAASSRDFGLTEGSRDSDQIALTEFGRDVVYAPGESEEKKTPAGCTSDGRHI